MLAIALVDIRDRVIHDSASLGLSLCLFAWRWTLDGSPWAALTGGALAFLGAEILRRLYRRVRGREGLGTGDVGLIGAAGLALSPATMAPFLIATGGFGLLWGGVSSLGPRRADGAEQGFPFAPALMAGLALVILMTGFGGDFPGVLDLFKP
jgi:leader peptidase (prepilin peptidase)/N-methyltransferase